MAGPALPPAAGSTAPDFDLLRACSLSPAEAILVIADRARAALKADFVVMDVWTARGQHACRRWSGDIQSLPPLGFNDRVEIRRRSNASDRRGTSLMVPWTGPAGTRGQLQAGWAADVDVQPADVDASAAFAGYAATLAASANASMVAQELARLDESKANLISNVSHELRTPLTSIRALSELLLEPGIDDATRLEFTTIINSESERLTRLVSDLLDLTRIQIKGLRRQPEPVETLPQLEHAVATVRPLAEAKGLELRLESVPDLPLVLADTDSLQQALVNLISNAVKFTDQGAVAVAATIDRGRVRVSIRDTGCGIAEADQKQIFDRFSQAQDFFASRPTGSGLGLAITREILALHGSDISVESTIGEGSTFSFVLRIAEARP